MIEMAGGKTWIEKLPHRELARLQAPARRLVKAIGALEKALIEAHRRSSGRRKAKK